MFVRPLRPMICRPAFSGEPASGSGRLSAGWPLRLNGRISDDIAITDTPSRACCSVIGSAGSVGSTSTSARSSAASTCAVKRARTASASFNAAGVVVAAARNRASRSAPSLPVSTRWPNARDVSALITVSPAANEAGISSSTTACACRPDARTAASSAAAMAGSASTVTCATVQPAAEAAACARSNPGAIAAIAATSVRISRANGPTQSSVVSAGATPRRDTRPNVGFSPATPQQAAGPRIEPPVSVPSAASTMPSPTSEAEPLDEPPGMRVASCGLTGVPV